MAAAQISGSALADPPLLFGGSLIALPEGCRRAKVVPKPRIFNLSARSLVSCLSKRSCAHDVMPFRAARHCRLCTRMRSVCTQYAPGLRRACPMLARFFSPNDRSCVPYAPFPENRPATLCDRSPPGVIVGMARFVPWQPRPRMSPRRPLGTNPSMLIM